MLITYTIYFDFQLPAQKTEYLLIRFTYVKQLYLETMSSLCKMISKDADEASWRPWSDPGRSDSSTTQVGLFILQITLE